MLFVKKISVGKGKVYPRAGREGPEGEQIYSSTLSLTSALDGVGGQRHASAALLAVETWYPLYSRLGGPRADADGRRKSLPHRVSIPGPSNW